MITLNLMTREIACLLGNQLALEFKDDFWFKILANQSHVDFICSNIELNQTLDDLSSKVLNPAANGLLGRLVRGNAKYCYNMHTETKRYDCYIATHNGVCIRGIVNKTHTIFDENNIEIITNLFRFDIRWSA